MTIPSGGAPERSTDGVHVPEDADPGLPAATGPVAAGGPETADVQTGGPATEAAADQAPEGVGSAESLGDPAE